MQDIIKENTKKPQEQPERQEDKKEKVLVSWSAEEYDRVRERSAVWYWGGITVASLLVIFALWQNNILFAIFIVIAWLVLASVSENAPKIWAFAVLESGITIGSDKKYGWNEIAGFDVHAESDSHRALLVKTTHTFMPMIRINIPQEKEKEITGILLRFIKREEYEESLIDTLIRIMRF